MLWNSDRETSWLGRIGALRVAAAGRGDVRSASSGRLRRALIRAAVIVALIGALLLGSAGPAAAHPTLLFTTPATDSGVAEAPSTIVLLFNEPVTVSQRPVSVVGPNTRSVVVGGVTSGRGGRAVTAALSGGLAPGLYTVRWRVTGADGDIVEGSFRFAVGTLVPAAAAAGGGGSGRSWPTVGLRWVLFAGLALALGGVVGGWAVARARLANAGLPTVPSWAPIGAWAGLVAVVGLGVVLVASTEGSVGVLLRAGAGPVLVVQAAGFVGALVMLRLRRPGWGAVSLLTVAAAEGVRSHLNVAEPGWGALLTGIHLTAAGIWVGALVHAVRAGFAWRSRPAAAWSVVAAYARWAAWLFAAVAVTGLLSALLLVSPSAALATSYGRLLVAKLAAVALVTTLAVTSRWWLRHGPDRVASVLRSARAEAGSLAVVLGVTAVLVSTPPVAEAGQMPAPPPKGGIALPIGTLVGQVGVGIMASEGQLVVRLVVPRLDDYYDTPQDQTFRLAGRIVAGGSTSTPVRFRGCGNGCFLAPANWRPGDNVISLRVGAAGWHGGTMSASVPWPPVPAPRELARAVAAMRTAGTVSIYETVTSDTTGELPDPTALHLSTAQFLASEPYGSGEASLVVRLPGPGPTRLALAFPAEAIYATLTLDGEGRIREEVLADPKHLIHRRFLYPAGG